MMMASLGPYAGFIGASYALAGGVVAILIAATIVDYRRQIRRLRDFERAGVMRRSSRNASDAT